MLANTDFNGHFNYIPYQEYESPDNVCYSNGMSGQWTYQVTVSTYPLPVFLSFLTDITDDLNTHHSMLVLIVLKVDKTTVLIATGQTY